jgi:hypothetical protein
MEGDQRKIIMEQEIRLREEKNKEEIRKENKAVEGDQRKIKMDQLRLREKNRKDSR